MSKRQTIMLLGVWVLVLPFLGFPGSWERFLGFVTGLVIIAIAYRMKPAEAAGTVETDLQTSVDKPYEEHKTSSPVVPAESQPASEPVHSPVYNPLQ
ncbi:MAG: hypothetical protein KGI49_03585 [Patescibacteria group bacterium]|nr:hypothetical protein [Patescibacteria group bacterium]